MKQLKYELYKVVCRGVFWCLTGALLAVCAFLYINGQSGGVSREMLGAYDSVAKSYSGWDDEEIIRDAQVKAAETDIRQTRLLYEQEPDNPVWQTVMEIARMENPELYEKVMASPETKTYEELSAELYAYGQVPVQIEYRRSYVDFLTNVKENAERMVNSPLFGKPGTFYYNNVVKTARDFARMENTGIGTGIGDGVTSTTRFIAGDVMMLLMAFILSVFVFYDEYRKGLFTIIRSCKNGRGNVIGAKLGAMCVLMVGITVLYAALVLALGAYRYGYGDLGRTIQSVSQFRNCTLSISVGQYLVLAFLVKGLLFVGAGLFFSFVFTAFKNNVATVVTVSMGSVGVFWILYAAIPENFILNHFKFINPFYYLDSVKLFGNYLNLNFFTMPVNSLVILPVVLGVVIIGSGAGAAVRFITDRSIAKKPLIERMIARISRAVRTRSKTSSLILGEGFKFFAQEKVLIMLIAVIALSVYIVSGYYDVTFREEEQVYRKYMHRLSGEVTSEKMDYYNGIKEEYSGAESQSGYRYAGFALVEQDYEYLMSLKDRGIDGYFADKLTAKAYFESDTAELENAVIFMAAVILCISALYASDIKKNMTPLLKSTPRGRGQLVSVKYLWAGITVIILYGLVYIPYYIYVYKNVGGLPMDAPMQSFYGYEGVDYTMTFGGLIAIRAAFVLTGAFSAAALVAGLSVRLKNRVLAMIISTALLCVPLLLQIRGIDMRWFSLNNGFLLFNTIKQPGALGKLLAQQGIILIIGVVSALLTYGSFGAVPGKKEG